MSTAPHGGETVNEARWYLAKGNATREHGNLDGAIDLYRGAVQRDPEYVDALYNLARALKEKGEFAEAADTFERVLALSPADAESWYMLGNVNREIDQIGEAVAAYNNALRYNPAFDAAQNNLGVVLHGVGMVGPAARCFREVLSRDPFNADAHHNLAMVYLSVGDYHPGWQEYEWRFKTSDHANPERRFDASRWKGEPLQGKSILLSAEQGRGDAIQFVRFVSRVKDQGGSVVLECQPELMRLFAGCPGVDSLVACGQAPPRTDFQIPLLSLPAVLGITLESLPSRVSYLSVGRPLLSTWAPRFSSDAAPLKVGLAWAGNPGHKNDRRRSISAEMFDPLLRNPFCSFYSLQRDSEASGESPGISHVPNYIREASDFADTAAILLNLDLVITVDTAIAHLAGALGIPVWTLLPFFPDWRWMRERSDSPWYPTMRLYRQASPGDWRSVIARVENELALAAQHRNSLGRTDAEIEWKIRAESIPVESRFNEAQRFHHMGNLIEAAEKYRQILQRSPDHCGARNNLAVCLQNEGRIEEAVEECREALRVAPQSVPAMTNLGYALHDAGRFQEAEEQFRTALALDGTVPEVFNNLGNTLKEQRRFEEAISCYRQAIHLRPEYVEAHWNLAQVCLLTGRMAEGWTEYEWRWKKRDFTSPRREFRQPLWDGSLLGGKTILLHAEQGFGDALQFVRYAPLVHERGGRILLECHKELYPLFQSIPEIDELSVFGDRLPHFDVHCPLMSLPLIMGTTLETIPASVPYLSVDRARKQVWSKRVNPGAGLLRVGLVWSGNKQLKALEGRSCPPSAFAALAEIRGIEWYSLQKGAPSGEWEAMQRHLSIVDLGEQVQDFADTAAAMLQLDLIISIDTAAAHLAGALGRRVWVLLPDAHDWRWMVDRSESPWYPTMRLFRQSQRGDWTSVIASVREALITLTESLSLPQDDKVKEDAVILNDRGLALHSAGNLKDALNVFRRALDLRPGEAAIHYNAGNTLRDLNNNMEAEQAYRRALALGLDRPEVYNNLGAALNSLMRWDEAKAVLEAAICLDQSFVMAYANLGYALLQQNLVEQAVAVLEKSIHIRPEYADAHWLLSHAYLLGGRLPEGWREYEWRWEKLDRRLYPYLAGPRWDGGPVRGKTMLLFTEQGYGDAIQFIRYAPLLADRGADVIVECQPELVSLFRGVRGIRQIIPRGTRVPDFDLQCPLMSLPHYFQTNVETIMGNTPYIRVDDNSSQAWMERVRMRGGACNVGLVWAGNPSHRNDAQRSLPSGAYAPLEEVTDVRFFSLQKVNENEGTASFSPGRHCEDFTCDLKDFGETAALIQSLDLVITVDTAVAHCAGALAKPVWLLLPFAPDWRWMLGREDTPWYPAMRIFRQIRPGDWDEVIMRVGESLGKAVGNGARSITVMDEKSDMDPLSPRQICR